MQSKFIFQFIILIFSCLITTIGWAHKKINHFPTIWHTHPFYIGISLGYGSTDWSQLVARYSNLSEYTLLAVSAPIAAGDRGFLYGFVMGYEIQSHFAMEMNYTKFPNTAVVFDPNLSIYVVQLGISSVRSFTYAYNIVGKFMVQIGHTGIHGFANAGGALIHRHDALVDVGHICPTFGVGINYVFVKRVMFELGFQYYAGYGKPVLRPAINYIPFLYAITAKIAYRF